MAGVKISALPAIPSSAFSDVGPWVQGGVTYQASLTQISTLFGYNGSGILTLAHGGTSANLTAANGAIPYSTASALALLAPGLSGQLFQSGGAGAPNWTTPTYPSASGTAGKILRSDGTNNVYSTSTFADTYAINTILYNASANTVSGLATGNSGALVTSAGGVPSISTQLPGGMTIASDPSVALGIATKQYVDQTALTGTSVYAASAATLGTVTQSGAGVGATLTNAGAQATFALDGVNPPVNSRVLIKNTAAGMSAANEGIYVVTSVGSGASNWVLTRSTDYDTPTEINRTGLILVQNGSTLAGTTWYNSTNIVTVDTTNFTYAQYGAFPVSLANGGTNASLTASNGGIFYSTASAGAILAGTATAGLALLSGSNAAPTWSTNPPITQVNVQVITTTGSSTYTPTAGTKFLTVEIVGGGGAGGSGLSGGAGTSGMAAGGGAGGYCRKTYTIAQLGANATVVIGTGGTPGAAGNNPGGNGADSTFTPAGAGAVLTAAKGSGGGGTASTATTVFSSAPGAGGSGTNGDINIPGGYGTFGLTVNGAGGYVTGGNGGASVFGLGAVLHSVAASGDGIAGSNYGSGGSGAFPAAASQAGGAGAQGVCYITEYISV